MLIKWFFVFFYVDKKEILWKELRSDTYMQTYFHWKKLQSGAVGGGYSLFLVSFFSPYTEIL